jgi:hypothetical protein
VFAFAQGYGYPAAVNMLLAMGASASSKDPDNGNRTPLHLAACLNGLTQLLDEELVMQALIGPNPMEVSGGARGRLGGELGLQALQAAGGLWTNTHVKMPCDCMCVAAGSEDAGLLAPRQHNGGDQLRLCVLCINVSATPCRYLPVTHGTNPMLACRCHCYRCCRL